MSQASHNRIHVRSAVLLEPLAYLQANESLRDAIGDHLKGLDPTQHANAALTAALSLQEPQRAQVLQAIEAVCQMLGVPLKLSTPESSPQFDQRPLGLRIKPFNGGLP